MQVLSLLSFPALMSFYAHAIKKNYCLLYNNKYLQNGRTFARHASWHILGLWRSWKMDNNVG